MTWNGGVYKRGVRAPYIYMSVFVYEYVRLVLQNYVIVLTVTTVVPSTSPCFLDTRACATKSWVLSISINSCVCVFTRVRSPSFNCL